MEIEADLQAEYQIDLGMLWRERQWRRLLNLIDQMPGATRLAEAIANDEEHVEQIIAARERVNRSDGDGGPRISEYTPEVARLDQLIDALQSNTAATIAAAGERPPRVQPQPRPRTAFERVAHRRRLSQSDALARRLLRRQE